MIDFAGMAPDAGYTPDTYTGPELTYRPTCDHCGKRDADCPCSCCEAGHDRLCEDCCHATGGACPECKTNAAKDAA